MWIIEVPTRFYGPFKTEREAAKWARKELSMCKWAIYYLTKP